MVDADAREPDLVESRRRAFQMEDLRACRTDECKSGALARLLDIPSCHHIA